MGTQSECSRSPSPDTAAVWGRDSSDSRSPRHTGGRPASPWGPAGERVDVSERREWKWVSPCALPPTHLHPLLCLVKAHEHVDDVEARRRLVLLVDPAEKCTESLRKEAEQKKKISTHMKNLNSFSKHNDINSLKKFFFLLWHVYTWAVLKLGKKEKGAVTLQHRQFHWCPIQSLWCSLACSALTTFIWCSSPRAWTQWWKRELMLSWIRWTSSPSTLSSLVSRYSRLTLNGQQRTDRTKLERRTVWVCTGKEMALRNRTGLNMRSSDRDDRFSPNNLNFPPQIKPWLVHVPRLWQHIVSFSPTQTYLHEKKLIPESGVVLCRVVFLNRWKKNQQNLFYVIVDWPRDTNVYFYSPQKSHHTSAPPSPWEVSWRTTSSSGAPPSSPPETWLRLSGNRSSKKKY